MSKSGILHKKLVTGTLAGLLLTVTACSSQGGAANAPGAASSGSGGAAGGKSFTIAMVTHEAPGSTFWDRIRAGAEQAAKQHGIDLKYSNDPDSGKQATLVQNAIDSKVDGIAVTLANPDAVGPALQKAGQAGIPTTVFNAGIDSYQKYGALMFFGSDESLAGQSAGQRLGQESPGGKALCVVHEQGNSSLETRCAGVKKGLPNTENLQVNGSDLPSVQQTIQAKLAQDPSITDIVTLDAGIAGAAVQAQSAAGTQAKIVTFDLSPEIVTAIKDKTVEFSVDQQPYLQGYEAVDALWLQLTNGNDMGGGKAVLTGPSFVDATNIDKIAGFAQNNTR
jgi:simple sugar transport system substrate-binding protein